MPRPPRKRLTDFGAHLRFLRHDMSLSLAQVADALDSSASLIGQYETGRVQDPDPELLQRIAGLYAPAGGDYYDIVTRLVSDKYGVSISAPTCMRTSTGEVFSSPRKVIEEIESHMDDLTQGWFFLERTESDDPESPYFAAIRNLVRSRVVLRFWIRDRDERRKHREALYDHLNVDLNIDKRVLADFLRYEDEQPLIEAVLGSSPASLENERVSEVFFFSGKPIVHAEPAMRPKVLLAYWTLPGDNDLTGALIRLNESKALERFGLRQMHLYRGAATTDAARGDVPD